MSIKQGGNTIAGLQDISGKANVGMDNLTSTGANIGNWSSNVTNCITEIPQDIKLELNNGTLTLKAGSKVYVPNGAGVFDEITIASDLTHSYSAETSQFMVFYDHSANALRLREPSQAFSGTTAPTAYQYEVWYDTTNNIIKHSADTGSTWSRQYGFPVCIASTTSGVGFTSIDQVFNGFGYIGSTKFALPGVKGLIPDGFNSDGTLKSIPFVVENVLTTTGGSTDTAIGFVGADSLSNSSSGTYRYDPKTNLIVRNSDGVPYSSITGVNRIPFTNPYYQINGKIQYCSFYNVFNAVDYSETEYIAHQAMPSGRYTGLTLGATGSTYKAPADGYFYLRKISNASGQIVLLANASSGYMLCSNFSSGANQYLAAYVPVKKGDTMSCEYTAGGSTQWFRFIYAEGAK